MHRNMILIPLRPAMKQVMHMRLLVGFLFSFALLTSQAAFSQKNSTFGASSGEKFGSEAILGTWSPEDNAFQVKIEKIGNKYYGKLVWLNNPTGADGQPKKDELNPDPALRGTPFLGLRTLRDMEYLGNDSWGNGTIYDPETGKTYDCKITLKDKNSANIRGFMGISILGKTINFSRID